MLPTNVTPSSPPPSFRSLSSSPSRYLLHDDSRRNDPVQNQTLADTFGDGSDSDAEDEPDDRQRLMRANPPPQASPDSGSGNSSASSSADQVQLREQPDPLQRRPTVFPSLSTPAGGPGRMISSSNDGVFANLAAKPERGEKNEDLPPVCVLQHIFFIRDVADGYRLMKKPPPMLRPRIGRLLSWLRASPLTKSMSTGYRSARSSRLSGMA